MLPFFLVLGAYLVGSVPFGLLAGELAGVDLRTVGSRNIGATNAARVLGRRVGVAVFLLDFAKGLLPVMAAILAPVQNQLVPLAAGVASVVGHIYPLYLRFRGGKGVATAAGAFCGLAPLAFLVALLAWITVLVAFRMVALASLVAAWVFPLASCLLVRQPSRGQLTQLGISLGLAVLITWRHRSNLRRMLAGEEPRIGRERRESS